MFNLKILLIIKKVLFLLVLAFCAKNAGAQLVVDSLGRVGVGTESTKSLLSVGSSGNEDASIYCTLGNNRIILIMYFELS